MPNIDFYLLIKIKSKEEKQKRCLYLSMQRYCQRKKKRIKEKLKHTKVLRKTSRNIYWENMSYGCAGLVINKERHIYRDLRKTLMFNWRERERERPTKYLEKDIRLKKDMQLSM